MDLQAYWEPSVTQGSHSLLALKRFLPGNLIFRYKSRPTHPFPYQNLGQIGPGVPDL